MATTKTLTPTNQAITLAAFTEKPDNRTNVTNDDRLADAVNTLNSSLHKNIDVATKNDLETRILAVCDAMSDASTCTGYARINFTDPSIGLNGSPATVTYSRRGSGIYIVNILQADGIMVSDYYYNNEHHWGSLKQDVDALNSNINDKLNTELMFSASSISDFLSQVLDYAVSLGNAGNRVVGITWQQHFFSNVTICSQSATRHVATVVPQPGNESSIYIAEYSNGTKTYKKVATTQLS